MGEATIDSLKLKIRRGTRWSLGQNIKFVQGIRVRVIECKLLLKFCSKGNSERVWFLEWIQQRLVEGQFFWLFKLSRVNCVYEFPQFYPQI